MQLVYLYIKEYKNIEKQGFNFSPEFECSFDGANLTVEKKENINNIFPKDINITAIVGKNGSGKSNLLEALICLIYKNGIPWDNYKLFAIFYKKGKNNYYQKSINMPVNITNNNYTSAKEITKYSTINDVFLFHYNYTLDYISNEENNINFNKLYHKTDEYKTPVLLQPNKADRKIDTWLMDYLAIKDILSYIVNENKSFKLVEDFFIPNSCKFSFHFSNIYKKDDDIKDLLSKYFKEEELKYLYDVSKLDIEKLIRITYIYILRKTLSLDEKYIKSILLKKCILEKKYDDIINLLENSSFKDLYNDVILYKVRKILDSFLFIEYLKLKKQNYTIATKLKIIDNKELMQNIAPWIDIEFFDDKNVSFNSLSYGQKFLVKFIYSFLNQLKNIVSHHYNSVVLSLDEIELGLHPQWQKSYVKLLVNIIGSLDYKLDYTLICSTHSPFILSDIPKQNIIFLKDGKNVSDEVEIDTFGANIHTLLSHGFFMEDGLMGEFAKERIEEVIKFLKGNSSNISDKEEAWDLINIIGEPFVKQKLQEMYFKRFNDVKLNETIKQLEKELQRLKNVKS